MARYQPLEYQGPNTKYRPDLGNTGVINIDVPTTAAASSIGYHDLDYLKTMLDDLINKSSTIYTECENQLQDYALTIKDSNLSAAQQLVYPDSSSPSSITFDEYKYLVVNNNSNAAQYIISAYENSLRDVSGNNALDISHIALNISNEAKRIKGFIDGYIGEVDDSSEYRTVELFQDWAESATDYVSKFWQALKGTITSGLPQSELDQLTSETASKYQALFQVKLNVINKTLGDIYSQLYKNWEQTSQIFYEKHLGPALQFQLKVSRGLLSDTISKNIPILASEATGTLSGINSNFSVALADQLKRNQIFYNYLQQILANVAQRDTYHLYLKQLAQIGTALKNNFTSSSSIEQSTAVLGVSPLDSDIVFNTDIESNLSALHSDLAGRDADDAHAQYLLRSGGTDSMITGNIFLAPGVRVDGMIPHTHKHTGTDGTEKLSGANIESGSITEDALDTTSNTPVPYNLKVVNEVPLISPIGETTMTVQISFEILESNVSGYEFEIVELA